MPDWLVFFLCAAAYALVAGITIRTLFNYGESVCERHYTCDLNRGHRWAELFAGILWFAGIPMYAGIWAANKLRLGHSKQNRENQKHQERLAIEKRRAELANTRRQAAEAEARALDAEITATNKKLDALGVNLRPLER